VTTGLGVLLGVAVLAVGVLAAARGGPGDAGELLLVTGSTGRSLYVVDAGSGVVAAIDVGFAPHGVAVASDGRAYVATSDAIAVVDVAAGRTVARVPYASDVHADGSTGEFRRGGMGIAISPAGDRVYVGVHLGGDDRLEVLDTGTLRIVGSAPIGPRPFDVVVAPDGETAYAIDHDGYSVTAVGARAGEPRTIEAAPLGDGAFDKPHYAAVTGEGTLLLPYQGRVLLAQDPATGRAATRPLAARTHQHGVALSPDGTTLVVVGTGPAGDVDGPPSATILDLPRGGERIVPLARPHEDVALSGDGSRAYLTGGYLLGRGAWDGLTVLDVATGRVVRELEVPERPLGIAVVPAAPD
jgi:DNA-binding beta-propeller fold protein YncE